ncbi:MAG TPA: type II secretion system protein [Gemmatimonadaceae bacterium]|nr:type II secretion system protein [Gemmatimonadaceae bacterium]
MRHPRKGFSLIELIAVCTIVGILMLMAVPRFRVMRESYSVQAARHQLAAAVAATRSAAVQKGRRARFRTDGNVFSAVVDTSATDSIFVIPPTDVGEQFGVTLEVRAGDDSVLTFDPRGFRTTPRSAAMQRYVVRRGASIDSLCVGMLGQLLPPGCRL